MDAHLRTSGSYPSAIAMASFSLLAILLIFPALLQHFQNRNIGATVLVAGSILANLMIAMNAVIWSNDDTANWYLGDGLCDVQIKLVSMLSLSVVASISCILRALANVMDTSSTSWAQTMSQRRRGYVTDLILCIGIPALFMPLSYITQAVRYSIIGIAGCQLQQDGSWLGFVINVLPLAIWTLVCVYYSVLILIRLIRYRRSFSTILASSNTTKSRFYRLYGFCIVIILGELPASIYIILQNVSHGLGPFSWSKTHHDPNLPWNSAILMPSYGVVYYDRIIWLLGAYLVFFFFGFGKDAIKTYRNMLLGLGLGRVVPALRPGYQRSGSVSGTIGSLGSKAKAILGKKQRETSVQTWTGSATSTLTDTSSPSPKKIAFEEKARLPMYRAQGQQQEKEKRSNSRLFSRLTAMFKKKGEQKRAAVYDDAFSTAGRTGDAEFLATVTAEPLSSSSAYERGNSHGSKDVLVMKEVRQASETAETLPAKMYEGV